MTKSFRCWDGREVIGFSWRWLQDVLAFETCLLFVIDRGLEWRLSGDFQARLIS